MLRGLLLLLALSVASSGCLQIPMESGPSACEEDTVAPDGTVIPAGEPYWTLTTDQVPIPDGADRVEQIPGLSVMIEGEHVEMVTRDAVVDGEDWMERRWSCQLDALPIIPVNEGTQVEAVAEAEEAGSIRIAFHYRHPDGLEIGYAPEPDWQVDGPVLSDTLPELREGRHDAFASVTYPDGSMRRHHFIVEFQAEE